MKIHILPQIHLAFIPDAITLNQQIFSCFEKLYTYPHIKRSHFFHGRFENIYINSSDIPEILPLLATVEQAAVEIVGSSQQLRCGYWFNLMRPGDQTSLHVHDEDDELLSAVYYIVTPDNCGDLVLGTMPIAARIRPVSGMLVFFPPNLPHAVETNTSGYNRLSIAFNFGPA